MRRSDCGGCRGDGRHWRWCPWVVGASASTQGQLAEAAEQMGDRIGANNPGAANHCYAASGLLREEANALAAEYMARNGTRH